MNDMAARGRRSSTHPGSGGLLRPRPGAPERPPGILYCAISYYIIVYYIITVCCSIIIVYHYYIILYHIPPDERLLGST